MFFFLVGFWLLGATWCVCKDGLSDAVLQKSLDFACGAGADCNPIHQAGSCFNPNTVKNHCSYAVNSYFQKKGQAQGTCDFAGTAAISTSDPSKFPLISLLNNVYFTLLYIQVREKRFENQRTRIHNSSNFLFVFDDLQAVLVVHTLLAPGILVFFAYLPWTQIIIIINKWLMIITVMVVVINWL